MKLSKLTTAVLAASLLTAGAAYAEDAPAFTTTGSVAFTTDYKFRGISQTSNNVAIQGSLTLNHESGVYATAWASSIDSLTGGSEVDLLLGYAGKAGDIGYDVGVMRYVYPGANRDNQVASPDYNEVYGSVSAYGAKLGVAYSDDYFGETGEFGYVYASYGKEVAGVGLSAYVGYNKFLEDDSSFSVVKDDDDYIDYKVAASKSIDGIGFELAYIGTDLDDKDLPGLNVKGSFVATVSKSF